MIHEVKHPNYVVVKLNIALTNLLSPTHTIIKRKRCQNIRREC